MMKTKNQKSEIIKNKNEHEHQITLQKLEDKFNLDVKHLNNIQDEKIKELNSEELINNKKAENKILELNLEKKKTKKFYGKKLFRNVKMGHIFPRLLIYLKEKKRMF